MYIIIHNEKDLPAIIRKGSFPATELESLLNGNNKVIVISLYSNTIKVPRYKTTSQNEIELEWDDYPFDPKTITILGILTKSTKP